MALSKMGWRAFLVVLAVVFVSLGLQALAAAPKINYDALVKETMLFSEDPARVTMVWWLPDEFWIALFAEANDPNTGERFRAVFRPYTVFIVVDGKQGALITKYRSKREILGAIEIRDSKNDIYRPLAESDVDKRAVDLIDDVQDVFARKLARFGRNMNYVFFAGRNKAGGRLCDPFKNGSFAVRLDGVELKWNLPLPSLAGTATATALPTL